MTGDTDTVATTAHELHRVHPLWQYRRETREHDDERNRKQETVYSSVISISRDTQHTTFLHEYGRKVDDCVADCLFHTVYIPRGHNVVQKLAFMLVRL